jgi:hypothetical protein
VNFAAKCWKQYCFGATPATSEYSRGHVCFETELAQPATVCKLMHNLVTVTHPVYTQTHYPPAYIADPLTGRRESHISESHGDRYRN